MNNLKKIKTTNSFLNSLYCNNCGGIPTHTITPLWLDKEKRDWKWCGKCQEYLDQPTLIPPCGYVTPSNQGEHNLRKDINNEPYCECLQCGIITY